MTLLTIARLCTCGVLTGGALDRRPDCPVHHVEVRGRIGIRHNADRTWWVGGSYYYSAWTRDASKARRFMCCDDALMTAFLECSSNPMDYDAAALPVAVSEGDLAEGRVSMLSGG